MGSRESFSTWESLENIYVLMEIVSQEGKTGDVGESGHKGRSTVMKRQVIDLGLNLSPVTMGP